MNDSFIAWLPTLELGLPTSTELSGGLDDVANNKKINKNKNP